MTLIPQFRLITEREKTVAVARLIKASTGDFDFSFFVLLAISMASIGLILDSIEVVIGSMLIAPILYPLLSLSLSLVIFDMKLLYRSLRTLSFSFAAGVGIAFVLTLVSTPFLDVTLNGQVISRAQPNTLFFFVAFISGVAATYALVNASLNELLPGVAISVSLVPPLAVIGIGLASVDLHVAGGATLLFVLNVVGIALASMITFTLMNIHSTHKVASSAIRQEEKRLEREAQKVEEIIHNEQTA